jgi:aminoglycoside 6'-N-acetyltransferase
MAFTMEPYRFRPFTRADLPMAARWLRTLEVVRWWGDPNEELALLTQDLDEPLMHQWIVEHDSRPFAYIQAYQVESWPQSHMDL